jgi:hypothetical protein
VSFDGYSFQWNYARSDRATIRFCTEQLYDHPVLALAKILQETRQIMAVIHQDSTASSLSKSAVATPWLR